MVDEEQDDFTPALARQIAIDLLPCNVGPFVLPDIGLYPASPEGMEVEHIMSHARLNKATPVMAPVYVYAAIISRIWLELMITKLPPGAEMPEEMKHMIYQQQTSSIIEASRTILANMFEAGFITYGEALNQS